MLVGVPTLPREASFIPTLQNIGILLHKQATLGKNFETQCIYVEDRAKSPKLKQNIAGSIKFFNYRCKLKHQLTRHLQIHDDPDDRKHKCEICGKGFIATQKLREHILTHTNIKPYKCELCNQAFSNFSGHRQHMMKKVKNF